MFGARVEFALLLTEGRKAFCGISRYFSVVSMTLRFKLPYRRLAARQRCQHAFASSSSPGGGQHETLIKICGVTSVQDAELAAAAGADFIGMIMWPKAKRAVQPSVARSIALVAAQHSAQAVGVFVDEDARTIEERCREAGLSIAQLHGPVARQAITSLPADLQIIYVMHAGRDGQIVTLTPADLASSMGIELTRYTQACTQVFATVRQALCQLLTYMALIALSCPFKGALPAHCIDPVSSSSC